jgi:uncharacterized membrane protein YccC
MRAFVLNTLVVVLAFAIVWGLEPVAGVPRYVAGPIAVIAALIIVVAIDPRTQGKRSKR